MKANRPRMRQEVPMAGSAFERMMTFVDVVIDRGKEAGLPPERIVEAVRNRIGLGAAGLRSAAGGGAGTRYTAEEEEQIRKAGMDPAELAFTSEATDFADYKRRKAAYRGSRGLGGAA